MRHVALLRGINVNGHRMIRMEDLRAMVATLGHGDVATLIQSGNVLFRAAEAPPAELADGIARGIAERFGLPDVPVVVLPGPELAAIVTANPFVAEGIDPGRLHATVLARAPERGEGPGPAGLPTADRFALVGRCVYVHCPNGYHRTRLTNAHFERRFGVPATTRNWNTLCRLALLAAD